MREGNGRKKSNRKKKSVIAPVKEKFHDLKRRETRRGREACRRMNGGAAGEREEGPGD